MKPLRRSTHRALALMAALSLAVVGGQALASEVSLSGASEVPPVATAATGNGKIIVADDGSVSGSVQVTGVAATMAHIHVGAAGKNGPVIVPLVQSAGGAWAVPPGSKLNAEQMKRYRAGELYVNVHSDAHKGGEIRAQMMP